MILENPTCIYQSIDHPRNGWWARYKAGLSCLFNITFQFSSPCPQGNRHAEIQQDVSANP